MTTSIHPLSKKIVNISSQAPESLATHLLRRYQGEGSKAWESSYAQDVEFHRSRMIKNWDSLFPRIRKQVGFLAVVQVGLDVDQRSPHEITDALIHSESLMTLGHLAVCAIKSAHYSRAQRRSLDAMTLGLRVAIRERAEDLTVASFDTGLTLRHRTIADYVLAAEKSENILGHPQHGAHYTIVVTPNVYPRDADTNRAYVLDGVYPDIPMSDEWVRLDTRL